MSSELRKYGSTSAVQTLSVGFTSEVSDYLVVHTGPGAGTHLDAPTTEAGRDGGPVIVVLQGEDGPQLLLQRHVLQQLHLAERAQG